MDAVNPKIPGIYAPDVARNLALGHRDIWHWRIMTFGIRACLTQLLYVLTNACKLGFNLKMCLTNPSGLYASDALQRLQISVPPGTLSHD